MEKSTEMNHTEDAQVRVYELGYHLLPTLPEEKIGEEVAALKAIIEARGGVFISEEEPYLRPLAYDIAKLIDGRKYIASNAYFGAIKFEVASNKVLEIQKAVEAVPHVLRFIIISTIRENTLVSKRPVFAKDEVAGEAVVEAKPVVSAEELDKTIDELVAE